MRQSVIFTIIPGVFFIVPMFLFTSAFLSTFSFITSVDEHQQYSAKNIWNFYKKKIIQIIPFNLFMIGFAMFLMPYLGGGPIWKYYQDLMRPCQSYWWTNALFINNFYPVNYDDKCMGWNWFIPVYL